MTKVFTQANSCPRACACLIRIREADRKVHRLKTRLANLRLLTTDTAAHYSDMPRAASPDQQKLVTLLAKIDELERQIPEAEQEAWNIRYEVGNMIDEIEVSDDNAARVWILRYLDRKPWQQIASEIGYAIAKTFRLHAEGMAALEKYLQDAP